MTPQAAPAGSVDHMKIDDQTDLPTGKQLHIDDNRFKDEMEKQHVKIRR